jgi:radical SAM superfamily enzyme
VKIIPIFIPHAGCPYRCVYCDQRKISGATKIPTIEEVKSLIERNLKTIPNKNERIEIAFYGGTFTLLATELQQKYLEAVYSYVKNKRISGVRISTHPEAVTEKSMRVFKNKGGCLVELGIQSLDKEVLKKSNRTMDFYTVKKAADIIKKSGLDLGVQVMLGLPGDTLQKSILTAEKLVELKPKTARIYPAIVLKGTGLAALFSKGSYRPLSMEDAIEWSMRICDVFQKRGIKVIRIGLHPSEDLNAKGIVLAGPYHPSFGEMVRSRQIRNRIINILGPKRIPNRKTIQILAPQNLFNLISGHNGLEKKYLENLYGIPVQLRRLDNFSRRSWTHIQVKDIRKDIAIIDPRIPIKAKVKLNKMGYYVSGVPLHQKLAKPLKGHPDMMLFSNGREVIYEPCLEKIATLLRDNGYECIKGEIINSHKYPKDIIYDACSIGKFIICHESKVEKHIENLKAKFIKVKQGYVKCSVVPIDEKHIITSDKSIYDKWAVGDRHACSLLIRPGYVKLPGYKTGFLGGASGVHKDKIFFIGSLKSHPDGQLIRDFIETKGKRAIELYNGQLYDGGSILFFEGRAVQHMTILAGLNPLKLGTALAHE